MKIQRVKMELSSKVAAMRSITKKDVLSFAKASLPTLALMGLYMLPAAVGFANEAAATSEIHTGIDPLDKPLNVLASALTGPIPKLVIAGSIAMGGMSWAMGWEQQVMSRCIKGAGGGAIAMGAGSFMSSVISDGASGCLF